MTIAQNSQYVLEHPFTKRAIKQACNGNLKDLRFIFDLLQIDTYQEVANICTKAYKSNKHQNSPIIEEAIREVEPPTRLNIKLPIPLPECIVVIMKTTNGIHRKRVINPQQLVIDFEKTGRPFQVAL